MNAVGTIEVSEMGVGALNKTNFYFEPFLFYYSRTLVALKTLMRLLKFIVCSLAKYMK